MMEKETEKMVAQRFEKMLSDLKTYLAVTEIKVESVKTKRETKIQDDDYDCRFEEHFAEIQDTTQDARISLIAATGLFHYIMDSLCGLVGEVKGGDWVCKTLNELTALYPKLEDAEKVGTLEYKI